ncbi:MAG TPA: Asp-tRNA(Asn)/Glu-tRNA(Gln) amidotransferase subunit GatA [Methanocorpusculum sp.]|jgi:aspartyl-tRNA(Asn)/glutamyl-tRNA(Gln) amidotransferase subunit A|nr:Asp-tRNA(Asn)/Glu-tRNA(Gln) amidotransferase subunit GatA [Methanocorpusculum sp.]HJJ62342.1 Asp-tRNA(Asn)/Glu-tRNA(Gln) amidotransferase subunit GatA [Methanocorpusculum sp.]HJJ73918.1 Asp-tRNA(Asn)/Glu-tRNA(Gln) amidotransferase subunit GatA [Methanocorpusculum sp.]HJJ80914.1 Asp-tRNA(Asn)/Glu-tRNA(Gln) amidotransferase subunit GatA [Methanocorpusculum sp.]
MADIYNAFLSEAEIAGEGDGILKGVRVAVKDNISTKDIETTCASKILKGYIPPYDAHAVTLLKQAGAVIAGKTNMDEFGMGSTTENSAFGAALNPRDTTRVTGGSSGGSAAAVAGGLVPMALGSDTGGSIRCPAAWCGIVGLKPSYGRVSRFGLIAYANSFEQIGPMANNVTDTAKLFSVIAGHDVRDSTSVNKPYDFAGLKADIAGKTIGIPKEYFGEGVDEAVSETVKNAIAKLEELGAKTVEVSLPSMKYALAAYYVTCTCEASSNLDRFDGVRYGEIAPDTNMPWHDAYTKVRTAGFGDEVRRRIILGTFALSAGYYGKYYVKARHARQQIAKDFAKALTQCDLLAGPTMPNVAPKLGELTKDPLQMYQADILTVPANIAGIPAISVPCGTAHNMPVGLQIMGRMYDEETVLNAALAYEEAC